MRGAVFLFLALMSVGAHSKPLIAAMADQDYPPYYYFDEQSGRWSGISVEVCEHIARELGYTLSYERYPFSRLLHLVSAGTADIACTLFNTAERAPGLVYTSVPHVFEDIWAFSRRGTPGWDGLDVAWLRQFQLGGVRAYFYGKTFDDDGTFEKLMVNNEEQLIKVLLGGRIVYALGNKPAIELQARRLGVLDQLRFLEPPVYKGPIYIGISRSRDDALKLAADFTRSLVRFQATPEYRAILDRYGVEAPDF